jgi:mono/diheme cytochrome c family protein
MNKFVRIIAFFAVVAFVAAAGTMLVLQGRGVSARREPSGLEQRMALFMRSWMTPSMYKGLKNPVSATEENFLAAREHFADHCASCHGNDGSGNTEMGRAFYPKAPDMRLPRTQQLSDGELFYFIENGIMMTGMPGCSTGTPEGEKSSWQLVHFIRRLPSLTPEDLKAMEMFNPVSRQQIEEERKIEDFLKGGESPAPPADPHAGHRKP